MIRTDATPDAESAPPSVHANTARPAAPPRRLVWTLGLTETISWGTLYFAFTVFIEPMTRTLGYSKP